MGGCVRDRDVRCQDRVSPFGTYEELQFCVNYKKPIFFIKVCDQLMDPFAKGQLPNSICNCKWTVGWTSERCEQVPSDLIDEILRRFGQLSPTPPSTVTLHETI